MGTFVHNNDKYHLDDDGFLTNFDKWDKNFSEGMALQLEMKGGLSQEHWDVINTIRGSFLADGRCPSVYEICRLCGLRLKELKLLFPDGYLRGACRLSGVTYQQGYLGQTSLPKMVEDFNVVSSNKSYLVDVRGFLIDPSEWDEHYAIYRAFDMKIPGGKLTESHWNIIHYIRDYYKKNLAVPTIYAACEDNNIELHELEELFPDGYHRGAVKIAGLRIK